MSFSFFVEMTWKSALIAGGALVLLAVLRSRSPDDRAALLRLAVGLLLLLPLVSLLLPALEVELAAPEASQPIDLATFAALQSRANAYSASAAGAPNFWDDPTMLIALLYVGGLVMVGFRLAAGLWTLGRWTRAAAPVVDREWNDLFERIRDDAGANPKLRLLVSEEAPSPLGWGWLNPVIILDRDTHDRVEDADAILAHEIAHVARGDWLTLMLARITVVLFWFNPLVWLLERAMIQEAEEAADSYALKGVEPARYAQTLLNCMQHSRTAMLPANSISSAGLKRRVKAVLEGRPTPSGSLVSLAAMAATVAFAAPVAALELTEKAPKAAPALPAPVAVAVALPAAAPAVPAAALPVPPAPVAAPAPAAHPAPVEPATAPRPLRFAFAAAVQGETATDHFVDGAVIAEAIAEAQREAGAEAREAALEAAREARAEAAVAIREARHARAEARRDMAKGAVDMERGADEMERGAKEMRKEAAKLRSSRAYREKVIAEHAARGDTVTHEELLHAAEGMERGYRGMIDGAKSMRQAAADMRRQRFD